jgi:hypothetical protein
MFSAFRGIVVWCYLPTAYGCHLQMLFATRDTPTSISISVSCSLSQIQYVSCAQYTHFRSTGVVVMILGRDPCRRAARR